METRIYLEDSLTSLVVWALTHCLEMTNIGDSFRQNESVIRSMKHWRLFSCIRVCNMLHMGYSSYQSSLQPDMKFLFTSGFCGSRPLPCIRHRSTPEISISAPHPSRSHDSTASPSTATAGIQQPRPWSPRCLPWRIRHL